ncbi:hypothetical protein ASPWEDRAFT_31161 [Aspergillus wentii DTO 134E9]|uniref:Uncharacterized protein n=1 Tax=Aspergillus wentii DTO 134E9 TaxID=1073089 RepID=A0A1L9RBI3_ASPWE|nr:uncharacterized protein ASPWEDRAFT_31161 [Aspergillus wentii DTO 134E9]KAI9934802.1 hypothetical protein MW887_000419 [Aspergillus wentii]OJJ32233.1 hypothetical protein ASPWEDRAFT_31161 [Aspergillus wentii DTO 134E9]
MADLNDAISSPTNAYHISPADQHESTTMQDTIAFIETKYYAHIHDGGTQFISLLNLPEDKYQAFEAKREEHTLPSMRVHYYPSHATAIMKLAGNTHETTSREIYSMIRDTFVSFQIRSNILQPRGASRQMMADGSSKEPDDCWIPRLTRSRDDFPSFVVELGEAIHQLRVSARMWIEDRNGMTRVVLLVSVDWMSQRIRMERWEGIDADGIRAQCVQEVIIDYANTTVENAPLFLPLWLMLDAPIQMIVAFDQDQLFLIPDSTLLHWAHDVFL